MLLADDLSAISSPTSEPHARALPTPASAPVSRFDRSIEWTCHEGLRNRHFAVRCPPAASRSQLPALVLRRIPSDAHGGMLHRLSHSPRLRRELQPREHEHVRILPPQTSMRPRPIRIHLGSQKMGATLFPDPHSRSPSKSSSG